jgi:hypothetical protein
MCRTTCHDEEGALYEELGSRSGECILTRAAPHCEAGSEAPSGLS